VNYVFATQHDRLNFDSLITHPGYPFPWCPGRPWDVDVAGLELDRKQPGIPLVIFRRYIKSRKQVSRHDLAQTLEIFAASFEEFSLMVPGFHRVKKA